MLWERSDVGVERFSDVLATQAEGIDVAAVLAAVGLPGDLARARHDTTWDEVLVRETEEVTRVGDNLGTPILSLSPPDGPAFFGPVISDSPSDEDALRYWEALTTLAEMPRFAVIKRTLRSVPVTGLTAGIAGTTTAR